VTNCTRDSFNFPPFKTSSRSEFPGRWHHIRWWCLAVTSGRSEVGIERSSGPGVGRSATASELCAWRYKSI